MRAQPTISLDSLNAVIAEVQMRDKYICESPVWVSENGHSLLIVDADSEEESGGRVPRSGPGGNDGEVVPLPAEPSEFLVYSVLLA